MRRPSLRLLVILLAMVLLAAGCRVEVGGADTALDPDPVEEVDVDLDDEELPEPTGEPTVEPPEHGADLEAPLEILEGPEDSTLAFVVVHIGDAGPYSFALDTGASNSVIDRSIADDLDLEVVGEAQGVTGVVGSTEAVRVQVTDWRAGEVDLGARPIIALDLEGAGSHGLDGLIGSDVLSEFGAITVDYSTGVLTLRPTTG
jgi:hypothetical protein